MKELIKMSPLLQKIMTSPEYEQAQKLTCKQALKFKEGPDARVQEDKQKGVLFGMILSYQNSINKFLISDNLSWGLKSGCEVIMKKLCKDVKCSSQLRGKGAYLDEEHLMIDRSIAMNQVIFVQVQAKSSEDLYVVPI